MKTVQVKITGFIKINVDEGIKIGEEVIDKITDKNANMIVEEIINNMDYDFTSNNNMAYITDSEITNYVAWI